MASSTSSSDDKLELTLGFHRGAIDQTTITTQPPPKVMRRVNTILQEMGVQIQEESAFHYRCIRAGRRAADTPSVDFDGQSVVVSPLVSYDYFHHYWGKGAKFGTLINSKSCPRSSQLKILLLSQLVKNRTPPYCMADPLKTSETKFASQ